MLSNAFDSGRLVISWSTGLARTDTRILSTNRPSCILDIGAGDTECSFDVPWGRSELALPMPFNSGNLLLTSYTNTLGSNWPTCANGVIRISVDAKLLNPLGQPVHMVGFFTWSDLEFLGPSSQLPYTIVCTSQREEVCEEWMEATSVPELRDHRGLETMTATPIVHLR